MPPEIPLQIWWAEIPWGKADYERPVVFLGHRSDAELALVRIGSNSELRADSDFLFKNTHADFGATGLSTTSYAEARMLILAPERFRKQIGVIEGSLRDDFEYWLDSAVLR